MRLSSVALPATSTAARCVSTVSRLAAIWSARAASAAVMSGSSATWSCSSSWPFWARASVRKLSSSRSAWSRSTRSSASSSRVWAGTPPGFAIATSRVVRIIASGVRSSCEALATNRRCASNAASKRSSSRSIVSASRRSSSRGPGIARRSCRFVSEIRSAVAVIVRSGANTRPATTQPSTPETSAMIASATPYPTCRRCRSTERCLESASANRHDGRIRWLAVQRQVWLRRVVPERELGEEPVRDRQQRRAADQKQRAVEQRQPPADGRLGTEHSQDGLGQRSADLHSTDDAAARITAA